MQSDEMKLEVRINEDDFHGVRGRSCQGTFLQLRQSNFSRAGD